MLEAGVSSGEITHQLQVGGDDHRRRGPGLALLDGALERRVDLKHLVTDGALLDVERNS